MRVLFVSSEVAPLAKTGGLADVSAGLPRALAALGIDVRIIMPGYPQALAAATGRKRVATLPDFIGAGPSTLVAARTPDGKLPVLLVDCPALYDRSGGLYLDENRREWHDNGARFALLNHAAAHVAAGKAIPSWHADVVHGNDWHTGLVPLLLRRAGDRRVRSLFTLHNMAFQGLFPRHIAAGIGIDGGEGEADELEFYGNLSFLKSGIVFSDAVNTVSPNYAREIVTSAFGCGMDGVLRARGDVTGILNGIDDEIWNPASDPALPARYDAHDLAGKRECKAALQRELGLSVDADAPLVAFVSRITHQKLADVIVEAVPGIVALGAQFVVIGEGDPALEAGLRNCAAADPRNVAAIIGYEEAKAHRVYAGADIMLAPARFEPCGLTPIYAMRYGTVPVVRPVGGLTDSVEAAGNGAAAGETATGFSFAGDRVDDLIASLAEAIAHRRSPDLWRGLQRRGMQRDYSWRAPAQAYSALYQEMIGSVVPFEPTLYPHRSTPIHRARAHVRRRTARLAANGTA